MLEAQVTHFFKQEMWCKMHVSLVPIHVWIIGFVERWNLILTCKKKGKELIICALFLYHKSGRSIQVDCPLDLKYYSDYYLVVLPIYRPKLHSPLS